MLVQYKCSKSVLCSILHQHWCTAQVSTNFPAGYDGSHGLRKRQNAVLYRWLIPSRQRCHNRLSWLALKEGRINSLKQASCTLRYRADAFVDWQGCTVSAFHADMEERGVYSCLVEQHAAVYNISATEGQSYCSCSEAWAWLALLNLWHFSTKWMWLLGMLACLESWKLATFLLALCCNLTCLVALITCLQSCHMMSNLAYEEHLWVWEECQCTIYLCRALRHSILNL